MTFLGVFCADILLTANQTTLNDTKVEHDLGDREEKMREVEAMLREMRHRSTATQRGGAEREKAEAQKRKDTTASPVWSCFSLMFVKIHLLHQHLSHSLSLSVSRTLFHSLSPCTSPSLFLLCSAPACGRAAGVAAAAEQRLGPAGQGASGPPPPADDGSARRPQPGRQPHGHGGRGQPRQPGDAGGRQGEEAEVGAGVRLEGRFPLTVAFLPQRRTEELQRRQSEATEQLQMAEDDVAQVNHLLAALQDSKEVRYGHTPNTPTHPATVPQVETAVFSPGVRAAGGSAGRSSSTAGQEGAGLDLGGLQDPPGGESQEAQPAAGGAGQQHHTVREPESADSQSASSYPVSNQSVTSQQVCNQSAI